MLFLSRRLETESLFSLVDNEFLDGAQLRFDRIWALDTIFIRIVSEWHSIQDLLKIGED